MLQDWKQPLHYASAGGHCDMVQQLLKGEANANAVGGAALEYNTELQVGERVRLAPGASNA